MPEDIKDFLDKHVWPQASWYWDESVRFEARLTFWTWVGIGSGFLATILAAFPKRVAQAGMPYGDELVGWLVVIASAGATLATGTLVPRYRRLATTREAGRVKTTLLAKLAEITLPATPAGDHRTAKMAELVRELMAIEAEYGSDREPEKDEDKKNKAKS